MANKNGNTELGTFNPYEELAYYKQQCKYCTTSIEWSMQLLKELMIIYNPAEEILGEPYRSGRLQTYIANRKG
jgi:hypothetical protein